MPLRRVPERDREHCRKSWKDPGMQGKMSLVLYAPLVHALLYESCQCTMASKE